MSNREASIAHHYTHGRLLAAITEGLARLGKDPEAAETIEVDDLGPVDEFHIGGRPATERLLDQLDLGADDHVLDVGCGLGGASRLVAHRHGSRVTGIDLTPEFVEAGRVLCEWVGLAERVTLEVGSATALPYPEARFDKAYVMHVGMNIADKATLMAELHRVLRPGGRLAVYDITRTGDGDLTFPLPWASTEAESAVSTPEAYRRALTAAGFRTVAEADRRDFALDFFARLQATTAAQGPPALGLHVLMGETASTRLGNMIESLSAGHIAPVEWIVEKPAMPSQAAAEG